jgi:hypothetical protein
MPNDHEFASAPYSLVRAPQKGNAHGYNLPKATMRALGGPKSTELPKSKGESVDPNFLLHHENHFDKNTYGDQNIADAHDAIKDPVKTI